MNSIRNDLLSEIEAFLATHKMAAAKFGQKAMSDMGFVLRLRAGRDVRVSTADKAREFMRTYKPEKKGKRVVDPSKTQLAPAA